MHLPSLITLVEKAIQLDDCDFESAIIPDKKYYQKQLAHWQKQLLIVQQAYYHQGKRVILVFEGWDASGKGGAIRRITEKLDPRGFRVYPIAAPTSNEQGRHYLYRFNKALPIPGRITIFDRSYYGRVLVERVEKFTRKKVWQRAYQEINEFERLLSDDGVKIIKIFMHISAKEQLKRFIERLNNPYKRWKLTEEDIRNRDKWDDYEQAINDMFTNTSTQQSRWHVIEGNHKWFARIEVLKTIVNQLAENVDLSPQPVDKQIIELAKQKLGVKSKDLV